MPVPVPPNTVRVNFVWGLPGGEIAVNALHFEHQHQDGNTLDWAGDMTQRYADLAMDGLKSVWANISSFWSAGTVLMRADAYHLGVDGATINKKTSPGTGTRAMRGTSNADMLPWHTAVAVSLYGYDPATYDMLGSRKRGRIYLPATATTTVTGGKFNQAPALATAMAGFVSYVQNRKMDSSPALSERARLVINSKKFTVNSPVTHVRVDDVFDIQRRRDNAIKPLVSVAGTTPQS